MLKKRKKRMDIKSKKGLTLVELVVGVTIVVIVFASSLGALVNGYITTMYNSDENKASALNASVNEIVLNTVKRMNIEKEEALDALDLVDDITEDMSEMRSGTGEIEDKVSQALVQAVMVQVPDAVFIAPEEGSTPGDYVVHFPDGETYQFSIIPETRTTMDLSDQGKDDVAFDGITIKTRFESANGAFTYESFVPYKHS